MYANWRQHIRHRCTHGRVCPTGEKTLKSQTLTAECPECRRDRNLELGISIEYEVE